MMGPKISKGIGLADVVRKTPDEMGAKMLAAASSLHYGDMLLRDQWQKECIQLIEEGAALATVDLLNCTVLMYAVKYHCENLSRILIARGMDLDARDIDGETALHWCGRYGNAVSAKLLVDAGAGLNARDQHGRTPYSVAVLHWHEGNAVRKFFADARKELRAKRHFETVANASDTRLKKRIHLPPVIKPAQSRGPR